MKRNSRVSCRIFSFFVSVVLSLNSPASFSFTPHFLSAPLVVDSSTQGKQISTDRSIVPSYEIKEEWKLLPETNLDKKRIVAQVRFLHQGRLIGEAWVDIDSTAVSIHACHLKSYRRGQGLGKEFAARIYERGCQISQRLGLETKYAHAYFTLSLPEENELDYSSTAVGGEFFDGVDVRVFGKIFRPLGLKPAPLPGKEHLNGYGDDRYKDHQAPMEEVVQTIRQNWETWFYQERRVVITEADEVQRMLKVQSGIIIESIQRQLQQFQQQQENLRILSSI